MYTRLSLIAAALSVLLEVAVAAADEDEFQAKNASLKILSRKKRYLVFPEGSSLQLVFCLTVPSIGMGNIFTLGGTAALAWELPHDPFVPFKKPAELLHRRKDKLGVTTTNSGWNSNGGKLMMKNGQKKTQATKLSPVSYFPSNKGVLSKPTVLKTDYKTIFYKKQPQPQSLMTYGYKEPVTSYKQPVTTYLHPVYHEVHRRTRRELYGKLEKFFKAQNKDGKACLLKAICEVSQASTGVGSFMEEILKTIFRAKPHDEYPDEDEYDLAAKKDLDCYERYSTCDFSIWDMVE